jgi:hypothetical protein
MPFQAQGFHFSSHIGKSIPTIQRIYCKSQMSDLLWFLNKYLYGSHHFPSPHNTSTYVSYWDFLFSCKSSCYHANMGFTVVRVLPSDPPHNSSRTLHCLSAYTSGLNDGCIRDFHPIVERVAARTKGVIFF